MLHHILLLGFFFALSEASDSPCCLPHQWEGEMLGYDKKRDLHFYETVSYDYLNGRARIDAFTYHDKEVHLYTLLTAPSRKDGKTRLYTIKDGVCDVKMIDKVREACVPEKPKKTRHLTIGGTLDAVMYAYGNETMVETLLVAAKTCVPIEGMFFEHHNRDYSFGAVVKFLNIKIGIGNKAIWRIPTECQKKG